MNNTNDKTEAALLRMKAEELLKSKNSGTISMPSEIDALRLVHELEVHQIELEMMNAQLEENAAKEKETSADLVIANKKLLFQNSEKEARAAELVIANKELLFQNSEKEARAAELLITHEELNRAHRREAELAENKYVKLYDFAPAGYFTLSKEGEILQLNVFGAALLGKERSQLVKARFGFFVSEDTKPVFNAFLEKVFYNNVSKFCEVTLVRNGKERLTVQLAGAAMENDGKCFVTVSDLTERKHAEEALRKSEENFRNMFREHSAVMMLVDPGTGIIIDANIAAAKYYGYDRSTLCSMNISAINRMPENHIHKERENALLKLNNYFVFYHTLADGTVRNVEVHSSPIDHQGKYILFSIIHDITDRMRAEEAMVKSDARYNSMMSYISDVIGIMGADGIMTYKSPNIEKWFGWLPQDRVGTSGFSIIHPDDLERVGKVFYSLLEKDSSVITLEFRYLCKDGSYKPVELTAANMLNDPFIHGVLLNYRDITERKQKEDVLRKSEETHRSLFEISVQGIVYQNSEGFIVNANPAAQRILGLTLDQMQGRTSLDPGWRAIKEDGSDFSGEEHPAMMSLKTGKIIQNVIMGVFNPADKIVHWIKISASPMFTNGQSIPHMVYTVFEDITELKYAENELRESETRFRSMISNISDVIAIMDADGFKKYESSNLKKFFGWLPEDTDSRNAFSYVHPDDILHVQKNFYSVNGEPNSVKTFEFRYECKDGSYKPVELTATNMLNDPLINGILVSFRDITQRKIAEEILKNERVRLHGIIEGTNVGTWEWNIQTGEVIFNPKWFEMIGYMPEELSPVSIKTWETLTHPDDLKRSEAFLEQHFKGERLYYTCECRMKHKDGTWVWVLDRGRVITRSADGKPLRMFGTHTDITQRKHDEEERERLIVKLQSALAEVKTLSGIIPICANCKKVRDDKGYWEQVESYVSHHTNAQFSHGVCPDCVEKLYPEQAERLRNRPKK
jgi:PAS domain S-box-containing protein